MKGNEEDTRENDDNQAMKHTQQTDHDGRLPPGCLATKLFGRNIRLSIAKEDQEEDEAANESAGGVADSERLDLHETEANPLGAQLKNAEQSGSALKGAERLAAADGDAGWLNREDVGEAGRGRSGAQQDEVRRDAFRSAPRDDAVVLGQVREEDPEQENAARVRSEQG